ncbi:MAG: exodeoxyribonuclease VII large subunit [Muribaculaceae bacterium]|nr:exodeoxyribonuclease VII large subunit [Muribaculaceae bacterium]
MAEQQSLFDSQPQGITLSEFNARIEHLINGNPTLINQWVIAETTDVNIKNHCYMSLVEKDDKDRMVAKIGAMIWQNNTHILAKFKAVTGMDLANGMKVMMLVSASFNRQFGMKVVISDIDPNYTLGDMARARQEILNRLTQEGIINNNKQLAFPIMPQRIAVISSATAAGYGDFMNQLNNNPYGLKFYTHLFAATMQGNTTATSVIEAMNRVKAVMQHFDCLVIIRGGGATAELNSFDNYALAREVALFPLPVVVGIGHERDVTVLDEIACRRVKTPTAAAELLIGCGTNELARLDDLRNTIATVVNNAINRERERLAYFTSSIPAIAQGHVTKERQHLDSQVNAIPVAIMSLLNAQNTRVNHNAELMRNAVTQLLATSKLQLQALIDKVDLLNPRKILNRGYSLTMRNGKFITEASQLVEGDVITTHFKDGKASTKVTTIIMNEKS